MQIRLLGPVEVWLGRMCPDLGGPLQRSLLAVLALHPNRLVSRARLISCLWGESPPTSVDAQLHQRIARLRRVMGRDTIVCGPSGYRLRVDPMAIDLELFASAVAGAREAMSHGSAEDAARALHEARSLWRGAPLGGVVDRVVRVEGPPLEERRLAAVELCIEADLRLGRHAELLAELKALVAEHPFRERPRGQLMLALHGCGRTAEALQVYREGRERLVDELGAEPGAGLRAIHAAILAETHPERLQPEQPHPVNPQPVNPQPVHPRPGNQEGAADATTSPSPPIRPPVRPAPAHLPPGVADFVGRETEFGAVEAALSGTGATPGVVPIVVISGPAGAGKTTLAVHAGHRLSDAFPDGQLYIDLRGDGPDRVDPGCALERFLTALGVDRGALPDVVEERTALFRSHTARARMLVVLDDAADEAQVRALLPAAPTCGVLITSTGGLSGLEGARRIALDVFEPPTALELLARIAGDHRVAADRAAALEIVQRCGFLPLAVRIAGAKLAARPHWSLRRLAERLADECLILDELTAGDLEVRAGLAATYRSLPPEARAAGHLLAQQPAPELTARTCVQLMGVSAQAAEQLIDQLLRASMLAIADACPAGQLTYRCPPLIRAYLREQGARRDRVDRDHRAADRAAISLPA